MNRTIKDATVKVFHYEDLESLKAHVLAFVNCFVPHFDGAVFSSDSKDALWDRFYTGAPRRRRRSVERYNIVKRA
jgi:hypothetical protein